jgi:hypothetical protein
LIEHDTSRFNSAQEAIPFAESRGIGRSLQFMLRCIIALGKRFTGFSPCLFQRNAALAKSETGGIVITKACPISFRRQASADTGADPWPRPR